jgi:hypothetical protein
MKLIEQSRAYSTEQYTKAGCHQVKGGRDAAIGIALIRATNGWTCKGCFYQREGCKPLMQLEADNILKVSVGATLKLKSAYSETVREEAKRRGLSINEVRRQRNQS